MRKIITIMILGYSTIAGSFAQSNNKKLFKEARKAFEFDHYRKATKLYEELMKTEPHNPKYLYHFGICNLMSFDYKHGLDHILEAVERDPEVDKYKDYWLGRAYHLNYMFNEAISSYSAYLKTLKPKDTRRPDIEKLILEAEQGYELCARPTPYKVENAGPGINTINSEHSPVVSRDGKMMIFTSRRYHEEDEEDQEHRIAHDGEYYERIFVSFKKDNGEWTAPKPIIGLQDLEDEHQATVELFDNDSKLLIYRNDNHGDIYVSNRINDTVWSEPVELGGVNTAHREADAFVSFDGNMLFISSSSDNLEHDLDLYYCTKEGDGWSKPISLGDRINTKYDENSPFLSKDGRTLYFSSQGHTSMGGYDVFRSDYDTLTKEWSIPSNVGHPINTPGDDIYFYYSDRNAWTGYFSSYRSGGYGEKDLYKVTFVPNVFIHGVVTEKESGNKLGEVEVSFVAVPKDNPVDVADLVHKNVTTAISGPDDGFYDLNVLSDNQYHVYVMDKGDTLFKGNYEVPALDEGDDLYYTYDIAISPERDLMEIADPILADHTTDIIDPTITELDPVIVPEDPILTDKDPVIIPEDPLVTSIEEIKSIKDTIKYFNLKEEDIKTGCRVILRNVYFDFDKATLKKESYEELNNLVCLLTERPEINIEISGHTDNVGPDAYNLSLSQKRADAIVNYLLSTGVSDSRLIAKGYGETRPLASNDDEEEGRELNRRTEFVIISVKTPMVSMK